MDQNQPWNDEELKGAIREMCKQPLDGLLYDLNLLPEQLDRDLSKLYKMMVIKELYAQASKATARAV
jgi:hypothetical protein